MANILKIVFVIIGGFIGAGFASGQEIYLFFFSYGFLGIVSLVFASFLFALILYKSLKIIKEDDVNTYTEFLEKIFKKKSKNKYLNINYIINTIINIFMMISFFIMIAGFGAYFYQEFGINRIIGSSILAFLCFVVFLTNVKGLLKVSEVIVPILILFILLIGIINIVKVDLSNKTSFINMDNIVKCFISGILYTSYNLILLIPMLITIRKYIKNNKSILTISIICGAIIFILSILVYFILIKIDIDISKIEMPVIYSVSKYYSGFRKIYGFVIVGAIFTTAISEGMSLIQNITKNKKSYTQFAIILCITSVIISNFGFSNLVKLLYPIFGVLGLVECMYIIKNK